MTTSTRKQQDGGRAHDLTVISLGRSTNTGVDEVVVPAGGDGDPTVIGRGAAHDETAGDGQAARRPRRRAHCSGSRRYVIH